MKKVMYSNLQKDILTFYKSCLKWANTRGEVCIILKLENKEDFLDYAKSEFRNNMNLKKNNFDMVLFLI
jgi:hypothetical protein